MVKKLFFILFISFFHNASAQKIYRDSIGALSEELYLYT